MDSFVHRSGRTARKGKSGTNILFFERSDMNFVLDLERKLNIKIDFTNSISTLDSANMENALVNTFKQNLNKSKNGRFNVDASAKEQLMNEISNGD